MGRKGVGRWKHNSKALGHYSSVVSGEGPAIELPQHHVVVSDHSGVTPGDQPAAVLRSDSDIYFIDDDDDDDRGDINDGMDCGDGDDSLDDAYEVYAVHAAYKSSIKTGALIALVVIIVLPTAIMTTIHFSGISHKQERIVFPAQELGFVDSDEKLTPPPYDPLTDFDNGENIPPYWEEMQRVVDDMANDGRNPSFSNLNAWGPCYPSYEKLGQIATNKTQSSLQSTHINWTNQVLNEAPNRHNNDQIIYPSQQYPNSNRPPPQSSYYAGNEDHIHNPSLTGLCRPGFLIIGQGKCGTSSLYHYLIGHPRVLPASGKQIDYFKYLSFLPMQWYLSHFPPIETFLGRGALMTGESSPSYLPYPKVPHLVNERMRVSNINGDVNNNQEEGHGNFPKIIAIVRDPIARAKSSYEYNYAQPSLDLLKNQTAKRISLHPILERIPDGKSESYYREQHLFSFEELVQAELDVLRDCLKPGGLAEQKSREKYGPPNGLFADVFKSRDNNVMPKNNATMPLINADEFCYGDPINNATPLAQWKGLVQQYPDKFIDVYSVQLVRSIIGRGLYVLFLDWWYERFPAEDIFIICTEDLRDHPAETMSKLSSFLGLPEFDFTDVTSEGMYNVGFHTGYDTLTTWDTIEEKSLEDSDDNFSNLGYEVELSDGLRKELIDFFKPYNERLFKLASIHCSWEV